MREAAGFSLVETLIAATIVVVGLAALAQLFVVSSAANARARSATLSTVLAQDKMEELFGSSGTDGDGVDFLDRFGRRLASGGAGPQETVFIRRWSVRALTDQAPARAFVIVAVTRAGRVAEEVRMAGLRAIGERGGARPNEERQ